MSVYGFIFSEKKTERLLRHVTFWFFFILHIFIYRFYVVDIKYLSIEDTYIIRLQGILFFLPASFFYAYFAIYFLLPRYILTGRYLLFFFIMLLVSIGFITMSYWLSILFDIRLSWDLPFQRDNIVRRIDFTVQNGFVLPLAISGFAVSIKMGKNFYLQQKKNVQLSKQKIDAEVQLIKSRVHPRFLFHSLNSIYNDMLNGSEKSPNMLLKLSELMSYILYESDKPVTLQKEVMLLKSYVELEKIGWGKKLIIEINEDIVNTEIIIEPLLLLPLAEYIFIYADKNKQQLFLRLHMEVNEHIFYFLIEAKSNFEKNNFEEDIQLLQVQKRLQAQYAGKHKLDLSRKENNISLSLHLNLKKSL